MKRFGVISLFVLAGLCTAGIAQAQDREVRATVPFNFVIAGKTLPSGNYEFYTQRNSTILIRNAGQQIAVLALAGQADTVPGYSGRLVFHKYGDSYFLREIHCPTISVNADFPQSKQEKRLHENMAWLGPDTVLLALNGN
ncbi:MAG: hypothetical protein JOY95_03550 [Silvibacterium sp.]|nr:hypothetical protein [Silvibacterium sp.]